MAGFMSGLDAESYDRQYSNVQLYKRILRRFDSQRDRLLKLILLLFVQSVAGTGVPILIARALDLLQERADLRSVAFVVAVATGVGVADWLLNYFNQSTAARAVGQMVLALRDDVMNATLRRDMRFFDEQIPGRIISRITSDTQEMGSIVMLFAEILSSGLMVLLVSSYMFYKNSYLALLCLATTPLIWLATVIFRRMARTRSTHSRRILAVLNGVIHESISGISVAKSFRQERAIYDMFRENNNESYRVNLSLGRTFNSIFPILNMLAGVGTAIVVYFGGRAVIDPSQTAFSVGDWYFFVQGMSLIFFPLTSLASFSSQLQNGLAASERVFALLDGKSELEQANPGRASGRLKGEIEFSDLHFRYKEDEPVFQGLNLHIRAGESVALVGHTGAGKSSIVNLLSRYYEFQQGRILVDGVDIRELKLEAYRSQLGIILQEQLLFDASVLENIRYGRPDASEAEVLAALESIGASGLVEELSAGLHTVVGEHGARLSFGQRQIVSMARTVLRNPAILVLDEATASVDPLTEVMLQKALAKIIGGRTTIIVAHRLTTIRNVDRIIALDHGRIVEEGSHDELMAGDGYYVTLYETYYRHQSLDYIEKMGA